MYKRLVFIEQKRKEKPYKRNIGTKYIIIIYKILPKRQRRKSYAAQWSAPPPRFSKVTTVGTTVVRTTRSHTVSLKRLEFKGRIEDVLSVQCVGNGKATAHENSHGTRHNVRSTKKPVNVFLLRRNVVRNTSTNLPKYASAKLMSTPQRPVQQTEHERCTSLLRTFFVKRGIRTCFASRH